MAQRTYERIKNYSTDVPVERTITEIEKLLTKQGAKRILKEYDGSGALTGLAFTIGTAHGEMPVKMPVQIQQIRQTLRNHVDAGLLPPKFKQDPWAKEQAARVGWRIIRDWLDAQLTLINVEMVKVEQIFLPYVYSDRLKKTVFDIFEERKFQGLFGPANDKEGPL